jgi:hypothetical protein
MVSNTPESTGAFRCRIFHRASPVSKKGIWLIDATKYAAPKGFPNRERFGKGME